MKPDALPAAPCTSRPKPILRYYRCRSKRRAFWRAAALALAVVIGREAFGMARLAAIEKLHQRAIEVLRSDDRAQSRAVVNDLLKLAHENPQLARARAALVSHADDIIDGADMIKLAERELMAPLDEEARRLVSTA